MRRKPKRVIIDTNLWISYLISKEVAKLDPLIRSQKIRVVFSPELLEEFVEVINRPKFKNYFSKNAVTEILNLFDLYGELIDVKKEVAMCRDPKDNFLLALAIESEADYLITGDKDLLTLKHVGKTAIVSLRDFISNQPIN